MTFLKRYKMELTVLGPVFIGSGYELKKKEWVLDRTNKKAVLMDNKKLFSCLAKRKLLKSYEEYFLTKETGNLYGWMSKNNLLSCLEDVKSYDLDASGIAEVNTLKSILTFVKDGYGLPYVPGSSIKGAIRNILLADMISAGSYSSRKLKDEIFNSSFSGKKFLMRESKELEISMFNKLKLLETKDKDAVNDIMRGIRISDSEPLDYKDLTLCQKIDIALDEKEKNHQVIRECIKPGTIIQCDLTIDEKETSITIDQIIGAVKKFLVQYNENFLRYYKSEMQYDGVVIYLGGGVGFASKTVVNQVLRDDRDRVKSISAIIDKTLSRKIKEQHKHFKDVSYGVSPHVVKLTEYDRSLFQFGPCRLDITEV